MKMAFLFSNLRRRRRRYKSLVAHPTRGTSNYNVRHAIDGTHVDCVMTRLRTTFWSEKIRRICSACYADLLSVLVSFVLNVGRGQHGTIAMSASYGTTIQIRAYIIATIVGFAARVVVLGRTFSTARYVIYSTRTKPH